MKQALVLLGLFVVLLYGRVAGAVPILEDKEKGIVVNVGALIQPTFQMTMPGSDGAGPGACGSPTRPRCSAGIGNVRGDGPSYDFFLRRARLMLWGTATKDLAFFVDTDEPNLGKGGTFAATTSFIQDAFFSYTFIPELKVDAGLMLVPLSHHTLEGATSLNALDYHADMIRFPTGRIFRDVGIQLRGLALNDMLHYRLGIFEGVRNGAVPAPAAGAAPRSPVLNPGGVPRFTAQVRGNILGKEPDFFLKGIYFTETPIVSVGLGADYQPRSVFKLNGDYGDYFAGSVDAFVDFPLTKNDELIFKANYFYYAQGATTIGNSIVTAGANAAYAEAGFRHSFIEPVLFAEYLRGRRNTISIVAPHVGVNFWITKHNFNIKTDFGYRKTERKNLPTQQDILWTTQGQFFF